MSASPLPPEPPPLAAQEPGPGRRKWLLWAAAGVLLLGAAAWVWWWRRDVPPEPPLPADITDPEVSRAVVRGRAKVLAEPRSADAWGEYGTILLANLFDREADFCFAEAAKRDPKDPRWPYGRGQIALKRDPPNAIAFLEAAAVAARETPEYRQAFALTLAEALLERGEVDEAESFFKEEGGPPDPERALFGLGLVAVARQDDGEATRWFQSAQRHPCCRKQARAQLARLARSRGDVTAAKQYEAEANALEPDPPWPDPYLDRVVGLQVGYRGMQRRVALLERDRKFDEAAELYLQQADQKKSSGTLTGAGINLARVGEYGRALACLREAVELDPKDSKACYTLALVLFAKWEKVEIHNPGTTEAAAGFREVVELTNKTTALKPDLARAYLYWGLALKFLGEPREALGPLRTGLSIEPQHFELHLGLGQVLALTGDAEGAEASYQTAAQLRPTDPRPTVYSLFLRLAAVASAL